MSVRTAWEIAALEDVSLAPSPRQQRPAPGPVCAAGRLLTLPGPPAEDPGAADRTGARLGLAFPSSRLFCGFSALSAPPLLWDTGGQELGSVSVPPCPRPQPWVISGQSWWFAQPQGRGATPSASASGSRGDPRKEPEPFPALGLEACRCQGPRSPRSPQSPPGWGVWEGWPRSCSTPPWSWPVPQEGPLRGSLQFGVARDRPVRREQAPQGSQTSGRKAVGAMALPPLLPTQAGPSPRDVLWFGLLPSSPPPLSHQCLDAS